MKTVYGDYSYLLSNAIRKVRQERKFTDNLALLGHIRGVEPKLKTWKSYKLSYAQIGKY